ncbi:haloacid dehalogenase [Mucilaginibacter ginkgonis]|uniref:Haloacid dehalogenase n=1 Tax=Mucilaginibacter ginkgonis TaxID=2682091 RepID=A0A7T7FCR1_9SPHI|nr:haloacid dehalogenase [Mucilaginibacter ginkgonis]QQL50969.1 haloacid dehalogenase [Mucilaginibacter ginkgonis]
MTYSDLDRTKKAFIFELDDVLYPQKDYLLQVYYLFAGFMEYTELLDEKVLLKLMTETYFSAGPDAVFDEIQSKFKIEGKYRSNLTHLMANAKLPLPLLLYEPMLTLLQDIVIDRKQISIVTAGDAQLQLNKIKQTEWHGLDKYLTCYFESEFTDMANTDVITMLLQKHGLVAQDVLMIGKDGAIEKLAAKHHVNVMDVESFLTTH